MFVRTVSIKLLLVSVLNYCYSQDSFLCNSKQTCGECIQQHGCVWCISPSNDVHCLNTYQTSSDWCSSSSMVNPQQSIITVKDLPLTSKGNAVQLRPQRIKISMRKNEEVFIPFQYRQAEDYPVDLYYIMDLSASMEPHRENLGKLGNQLARTMRNITNNFRLGFGSFVDKITLPYVSTTPQGLKSPCSFERNGIRQPCAAPYSFKNHLSLTSNYDTFVNEVGRAWVSGNIDSPEGGFDALMQAIVCKEEIGWRPQARHLIVFSTDELPHIAGDGKLGGVVEPNDAKCHMTDHEYTHHLRFDYPSISHINQVARQNNINIVFAIVNKLGVVEVYKGISEKIENSNIGALDRNSANVVNLVVENYNKIVDSVTINADASSDVEVKIIPSCKSPMENGCKNIHVGEIVNFTALIKALECPQDGSKIKKVITVKPEAMDESITIELEIICECDCAFPPTMFFESNSKNCSYEGNLECGICSCNKGNFGKYCECSRSSFVSDETANCQPSPEDEICSGLGQCRCGRCQCIRRQNSNEQIYGKYCECNNYSCKREGGLLCSGKGLCDCGLCKCHAGWTGDSCQCPETKISCMQPRGNGILCSGNGNCNCGKCECFVNDTVKYSGKYCQECTSCPAQRCGELKNCVECQVFGTGKYDEDECRLKCTEFTATKIDKLEEDADTVFKRCTELDEDGCKILFEYTYNEEEELIVQVVKEKNCPAPPNVLAWVLGVVGTILLGGLIMLIAWKIFTTVHDRIEYAKFVEEKGKMKWHTNQNPLYKTATTTFQNPAYRPDAFGRKDE